MKEERHDSDDKDQLTLDRVADFTGIELWMAGNAWERNIRRAMKSTGLTHVQLLMLDALLSMSKNNQLVTQNMVAKKVGVERMMTSNVMRLLESRGFILRKDNPNDKRALEVVITKKGKKVLEESLVLAKEAEIAFFESLGDKVRKFRKNLQKLQSRAEEA